MNEKSIKSFILKHTRDFHKTQGKTSSKNKNALKIQKDLLFYFTVPCRTPVSILVERSARGVERCTNGPAPGMKLL